MSPIEPLKNSPRGGQVSSISRCGRSRSSSGGRARPTCWWFRGLWHNSLITSLPKLRFVQSFSAGTDQYDKALFARRGVRLANAEGVNERAVAEHAMALTLALARQLHKARDNQRERRWRGMIGDRALCEQELGGRTLVVVGLGRIGTRLARLARAFDMRVIGVRRTATLAPEAADEVVAVAGLEGVLAKGIDTETLADFGLAAMMANDNDLIRSPSIPV